MTWTSKGIPRLRRAIAHWYRKRYDVEIDADAEAVVTIDSKEGLAHLMLATLGRATRCSCPTRALGSLEFAKLLLEKAKVSVSPGIGCGDSGDDHVRFAQARIRSRNPGSKPLINDLRAALCVNYAPGSVISHKRTSCKPLPQNPASAAAAAKIAWSSPGPSPGSSSCGA